MNTLFFKLAAVGSLSLSLLACASMGAAGPGASSRLEARSGSSVSGQVRFVQASDHLMVKVEVTGLKPGQQHGFHIHDKGDCSAADGSSAAGHFNPGTQPHGPQNSAHHAGDMPALTADANGHASAHFPLTGVNLTVGPTSVIGRALIVHKDPDDYTTQPTGNSGARVACGVIVKS